MYKRGDLVEIIGSTDDAYNEFLGSVRPIIGLNGTIIRESPNIKGMYEVKIGDNNDNRWYVYQGDLALVANKFNF